MNRRRLVLRSVALSLVFVPATLSFSQDASFFTINEQNVACLLENKDAYLATGSNPVVIVTRACPEPNPSVALKMLATNSNMPEIPTSTVPTQDIIVYTPAQLACLTIEQIKFEGGIALLPEQPLCP